jgi:hypothetical protein
MNKLFLLNQRGQAALVDSLFFIAIVSIVCTGLFYFTINYGTSTETLLNSFYSSDFAMDSLKVISYVNVMRDGTGVSSQSVMGTATNPAQFDYMLAMIKEDYARNKEVSFQTKTAIANTIHSVLKPFDDSIDYVYYIKREGGDASGKQFLAFIIATRKCTGDCCDGVCTPTPGDPQLSVERTYYACNPSQENVMQKFIFPYVGRVDSAVGRIALSDFTGNYTYYLMGIDLWVAKKTKATDDIVSKSEETDPALRESDFDCNRITITPTVPAP